MNTREEIEQALQDYQAGALASRHVEKLKIFNAA
jgi:redox-sensitive bicupin YhaK (pirin superfamily)